MPAQPPKPKYAYYIYELPEGNQKGQRIYFKTYEEAKRFTRSHRPHGGNNKGLYHIYPVDNSGYTSPSDGRKSFGEGNKEWSKNGRK